MFTQTTDLRDLIKVLHVCRSRFTLSTRSRCWTRAVFAPLRLSRPPDCHQHVPAKTSGEWLVQPPPREAETENNRDRAAIPQQATGARVLHITLPRGRGGKASPLKPICPVLTLAHKCTLQHTHTHMPSCNHAPFTTVRCIHTHTYAEFLYLYCTVLLFIWVHISTLSAFDSKSKVSKIMPRWEKATFLCCSC